MNKIIKQEQIQAILKLAQKYNVGIQEYSALVEMLGNLPDEKKQDETKNPNTKTEEVAG